MTKNEKNTGQRSLVRVTKDFVFKRVFGAESHKRVLVCLLNSILKGKPYIDSVELLNTELTNDMDGGKNSRLDIRAKTSDKSIVVIEMQCSSKGNLLNRSAFYNARMIPQEIRKGDSYDSLPETIFIWIAADHKPTKRKHHTHEAVQMFKDNGIDPIEIASEKLRTFIIELEKMEFKKVHHADMFAVWMMFIKHPESIPEEFLSIPEIKEAMDELTFLSHDPEFREEYDARQKLINDENAERTIAIQTAEEEGREKGIAEGMEKGAMEKAKETAKKLLLMGLSQEQVSEATGLPMVEIRKVHS